MMNHSENFVDSNTVAHTITVQGVWSLVKRKLKAMNGAHGEKLPGYLDEFNWRRVYPGDHLRPANWHRRVLLSDLS